MKLFKFRKKIPESPKMFKYGGNQITESLLLTLTNEIVKRTFYRLLTPGTFSNIDCVTLDEAKQKKIEFGSTAKNIYYPYWQDKMRQCKIVKVTEIVEDVNA